MLDQDLFNRLVISQLDLLQARECVEQIIERDLHNAQDRRDQRLHRCLNTALIVSYWRPFSGNIGTDGKRERFPQELEKELFDCLSTEELDLHSQIGVARNTEQAHADARPRQVRVRTLSIGDSKIPWPIYRDPFVPLSAIDTKMILAMIDKLLGVLDEQQSQGVGSF